LQNLNRKLVNKRIIQGYQQRTLLTLYNPVEVRKDLAPRRTAQLTSEFTSQDQLQGIGRGASDRDPLLLPARHLIREMVFPNYTFISQKSSCSTDLLMSGLVELSRITIDGWIKIYLGPTFQYYLGISSATPMSCLIVPINNAHIRPIISPGNTTHHPVSARERIIRLSDHTSTKRSNSITIQKL